MPSSRRRNQDEPSRDSDRDGVAPHAARTREEITTLLEQVQRDEPGAVDRLFDAVYQDLRVQASQQLRLVLGGGTLDTTVIVNEAALRLLGRNEAGWRGRRHFFFAAARAMHDVIVEHLRAQATLKRGAGWRRTGLEGVAMPDVAHGANILAVSDALTSLRDHDGDCADIVMLRFFGGQGFARIADVLGSSETGVRRSWAYAQAWLRRHLEGNEPESSTDHRS